MIIKKIIQTTIDISAQSPDLFDPDRRSVLIRALTARYVGVCYQASYILEILDILQYSAVHITSERPTGAGSINVTFEAKCLIYNDGEILCGAKITHIHPNMIIVANERTVVIIRRDETRSVDKTMMAGQILPCTVDSVSYDVGRTNISVQAHPTLPADFVTEKQVCYEIKGGLTLEEKDKIIFIYAQIQEILAEIKNFNAELINLFVEFLYPYKKHPNDIKALLDDELGDATPINLMKEIKTIIGFKAGTIIWPSQCIKYESTIYSLKNVDRQHPRVEYIYCAAYPAFSRILNDFHMYLLALRALVGEYTTVEKIRTNGGYFAAYDLSKLDLPAAL